MKWDYVLFTLANAGITVAFGYITSRQLEKHKRQLDRVAYEHQTKYSQMHQKRAEVIVQLYSHLRIVEWFCEMLALKLQGAGVDDVAMATASDYPTKFEWHFKYNRLFLEEALCVRIDSAIELVRTYVDVFLSGTLECQSDEQMSKHISELQLLHPKLREIRRELESDFRAILGVPNEPKRRG